MFFAIHFFTDFIDLSPKKTMQFIRENPFRKVKKDFKTFVFDVGITLNREKYQSQMLPTAWFCPLFFIWVASGNSAPRVLRKRENSPPRKMTHLGKKSRSTLTCNYAQATRLKIQVSILNICFIEKWSHVSMILFAPAWILETGSNNNNAEDNYTFLSFPLLDTCQILILFGKCRVLIYVYYQFQNSVKMANFRPAIFMRS